MKVLFRGVILLIICASVLVIFGDNVIQSDYVQRKFYPNDYWPPKIEGMENRITELRSLIYQAELDIEEAKLLGKYAVIDEKENQGQQTPNISAEETYGKKIHTLQEQLSDYKIQLKNTQELLTFASQFKKEKKDY